MPSNALPLRTSLAWAKGAYTVAVDLGSDRQRANLLLDSGSSTLAVGVHAYAAELDHARSATAWAQAIGYAGGRWAGPVLRSRLTFGAGRHARSIEDALFALIETPGALFREADGIFGLAYRRLDPAHDMSTLLRARGVDPPLTWPWPFASDDPSGLRDEVLAQPGVELTPAFTALEEGGVVRDQFALQVRRALVHVADAGAGTHALAADPLNRGMLVLGGGLEQQSLYHGPVQELRVVHDLYYNLSFKALRVGDGPRIEAPPLPAAQVAHHGSNALLDTGSSFLVFEASVYAAMLDGFARHDPLLPALLAQSAAAFQRLQGLPNHLADHRAWPDLHLHLEAPGGGETVLRVPASHYWPHNALAAGQTLCLLMAPLPGWPPQSILGLPLLCGRYAVFDRRVAGSGVVRVAQAREP